MLRVLCKSAGILVCVRIRDRPLPHQIASPDLSGQPRLSPGRSTICHSLRKKPIDSPSGLDARFVVLEELGTEQAKNGTPESDDSVEMT